MAGVREDWAKHALQLILSAPDERKARHYYDAAKDFLAILRKQ